MPRAPAPSDTVSLGRGVRSVATVPYHSILPAAIEAESAMNIPLITAEEDIVPKVQAVELLAEALPAGVAAAAKTID